MKQITKEELAEIYYNNSNKKACEILGVTNSTLIKYLRKANIKLKGSGNGKTDHRSKLSLV